jgi:hypothetical protein
VADRTERSIAELRAEADGVASGDLPIGEFVADLDWALPAIGRRGGAYAPQAVAMIADALDDAAFRGMDGPAARALAEAAAVAAEHGDNPSAIQRVHHLLADAGLARGAPPAPRVRGMPARKEGEQMGTASPPDEPVDSALDPEIARLARRVSPSRSALAPLRVLGLGWAVVLMLVIGVVGGRWLDTLFATAPLLTIVGTLLGLLGAYATARSLVRQSREL